MKTENFLKYGACPLKSTRAYSPHKLSATQPKYFNTSEGSLLTSENLRKISENNNRRSGNSDRDSERASVVGHSTGRIKRRSRNLLMKSTKGISKKSKTMDYTNYAYNEAVGRLKVMLADNSYTTPKLGSSANYLRNFNEDSGDNFSDNLSAIERPVFSDISKYLSPSQKSRISSYRPKNCYGPTSNSTYVSASKENLAALYTNTPSTTFPTDNVPAPVEIFNFIEKQEDYIDQLEKESKYCRSELTNLLGKVKDVINENEQLTENARTELTTTGCGGGGKSNNATTSPSSDSDDLTYGRKATPSTPRKSNLKVQSPRYNSAPNIVYEARISELEAELMQAHIDLKRVKTENEDLKRKIAYTDPLSAIVPLGANCETHRKQLELLQQDKIKLEESVHHLQRLLDEAKSQGHGSVSSKRYIQDLMQMERSQAELEVRHLRDELDRQHERVRELQHEMARRLAEERASAERRYNTQVDQLGGDLSSQWEQVAKLQLELERQKRYETDLKRDVANRNSQIEELKMELRANRTTFLADMAQVNAEKQSLEQEITSLRLQLDRSARDAKTEASRLNAEINSLRQRLDRGDADLLHSKREVLRLNDEIANLEKELAYGELKNEIRPTKKDLDKRISEMQDKHAGTVNELEEMITSQKQLMDKLTNECKTLTVKLEDTTYRHNQEKVQLRATNEQLTTRLKQLWAKYKAQLVHKVSAEHSSDESPKHNLDTLKEISALQSNLEYLSNRILSNEEHMSKLDTTTHDYANLVPAKAAYDYQTSTYGTTIEPIQSTISQLQHDSPTDDYPGAAAGSAAAEGSSATNDNAATGRKASISHIPPLNGLNDNDDENLKDNLGLGEKQHQQQPEQQREKERLREREERERELRELRGQREKREREREQSDHQQQQNDLQRRYSNEASEHQQQQQQPQSDTNINNAGIANLAAYNTDYSAYDQQQYDASAYDTSGYPEQSYDPEQYAAYDYNVGDYGQTGYQYDATPAAAAAATPTPAKPQSSLYQAPRRVSTDYNRSPPPITTPASALTSTSPPTSIPSTTTTGSVPTESGAVSTEPSAAASRLQSRPSSGVVGPSTSTGAVSGNKSSLSQQPAPTGAGKK